jgi:hypothetical protein
MNTQIKYKLKNHIHDEFYHYNIGNYKAATLVVSNYPVELLKLKKMKYFYINQHNSYNDIVFLYVDGAIAYLHANWIEPYSAQLELNFGEIK